MKESIKKQKSRQCRDLNCRPPGLRRDVDDALWLLKTPQVIILTEY